MPTPGVYQRCLKGTCPVKCRIHRWAFHVELGVASGKRIQRTKSGFSTQREAKAARDALVAEFRAGRLPLDRHMTVATYLDDWLLRRKESQSLRPKTLQSYSGHIEKYLKPQLGSVRLVDLRASHIENMLRQIRAENKRRPRPMREASQVRLIATLRSALREAVRRGDLAHDPTAHVVLPRSVKGAPATWSVTEFVAFMDHCREEPLRVLFWLGATTGMRRGEMCGLRWEDINLDDGRLVVAQQRVQIGKQVITGPPKTDHSHGRVIFLDAKSTSQLRGLKAKQSSARLALGQTWVDSGLVFVREDGEPYKPDYVSKRFAILATRHSMPSTRLHSLRHLSASLGAAAGETLLQVSRRLGHGSISITADTYSYLFEQETRALADQRAAVLST